MRRALFQLALQLEVLAFHLRADRGARIRQRGNKVGPGHLVRVRAAAPDRVQACAANDVLQIGTGETLRLMRDPRQIDVSGQRHLGGVDLQDMFPPLCIGRADIDQLIQPSGAQQRRIDQPRPVGRADQHHARQFLHPVHFGQNGVDDTGRHLRLVSAAAACGHQTVDLVDEDHARRNLPRAGKQAADLLLALAKPLGQQVGRLDRDEVRLALLGDRLGQQGLAGSGRAIEQEALGRTDAQPPKRVRVLQRQFDPFAQLVLRLARAANISPANVGDLHHHFAHGGRLNALQRGQKIIAGDVQAFQHFRRDRLCFQVQLRHDPAHCLDRGLARQCAQVRADKTVRGAGQFVQIDAFGQRHPARVDAQNFAPPAFIRHADHDFTVEPAGPPQRLVQRVRPVGGGDHHDVGARVEPVHQRQQLRDQPLFRLARRAGALGRDRIDLVHEDDRRRGLGGFLEHFAQAAFAFAIGRAHDFRAVDGEEAGVALVRHGLGQPGLAGARRAVQQHALGRIDAKPREQFGIAQRQFDHFAQLADRVAHAPYVVIVDVPAPGAGFLELLAQLDFGLLVDVDHALGHGRHHGQADLGQREGGGVEHPGHLGRHVAHLRLSGGGHQIASSERSAKEIALQRLARPLQAHFTLGGGKYHALGRARFALADLHVIA